MKLIFNGIIFLLLIQTAGYGQLRVRVTSAPDAAAYASNSNELVFKTNSDGSKTVNLLDAGNSVSYSGSSDGSTTVSAKVNWDNLLPSKDENSSIQRNVYLMDADFYIPQLDRKRKVWVYLPPDYETSSKRYPVIYMQDGQNLFNEKASFSGEWGVDETMNALFSAGDYGAIIIAVENGGWRRLDEYSPWYNNQLEAGGEGKKYGEFLVKTLKPYVDATYRTRPEREYTGLMGSSMGGLISHYIGMEYQNVFSKIGVMSPSFWFSKEVFNFTSSKGKRSDMKYCTIAGQGEGSEMTGGLNEMYDALKQAGFADDEVRKTIHIDGQHKESYWSREFGTVYQWLFDDLNLVNDEASTVKTLNDINFKPNADFTQLWIENFKNVEGAEVQIKSEDGKYLRKFSLNGEGPLDISSVLVGTHVVSVKLQNRVIHTQEIVVKR